MRLVKRTFRPELLNRIGDIIMFNPLNAVSLRRIIRNTIGEVNRRLEESDKRVTLTVSDSACDFIVEESYSPEFGARPLNRYVEKNVVTEISRMLFNGSLWPDTTVHIHLSNESPSGDVSDLKRTRNGILDEEMYELVDDAANNDTAKTQFKRPRLIFSTISNE